MTEQLNTERERFEAWFKVHYIKHGFITSKDEAFVIWQAASTQGAPAQLSPAWAGEFKSFADWCNRAQDALKSPSHRPAVCIDAKGRRCAIGKDFMLAQDDDAFPVRYFWEFDSIARTVPDTHAPGWISVEDRLPDEETTCLVYTPANKEDDERRDLEYFCDGCWNVHNDHYEHFMAVGGAGAAGPDSFCIGPSADAPYTHWMPLPAAPSAPGQAAPAGARDGE